MKKRNRSKRIKGRGAILAIVALLASSAILRVGAGPGQALAQAVGERPAAEGPAEMSPTGGLDRSEMSGLLAALRAREERVKAREKQVEIRSKALAIADEEITKRLKTLEETEENLRRTLALADGAAEDDLARLTSVYENMKPKEAAALFSAMEPDFAAGFLGRMRPDAAAAVMAGLPPETAYSISVILAGRNAKAPKS
ncbi:MAG: hypothetical protein AAF307_00420 [Pseudomonadota bacterium]